MSELQIGDQIDQIWLVKVPTALSSRLVDLEDNTLIGSVQISIDPTTRKVSKEINLNPHPLLFESRKSITIEDGEKETNSQLAFQEISSNQFRLLGNCTLKSNLKPRDPLPPKATKKVAPTPSIKILSPSQALSVIAQSFENAEASQQFKRKLEEHDIHENSLKTSRKASATSLSSPEAISDPQQYVTKRLFQLFETSPYYKKKDILMQFDSQHVRGLDKHVTDFLTQFCDHHKDGPAYNHWELKSKYKGKRATTNI